MSRRQADRLLDEMIRENRHAEEEAAGISPPPAFRFFGGGRQAAGPLTRDEAARLRDRRGDLTIAALGVTLGLICALFPWYIFFNPDEFGVRAMQFGGRGTGTEPILLGVQPERIGAPVADQDVPFMELDLRSTGSAVTDPAEQETEAGPGPAEQPFPPPVVSFRVVQISNGRAMLEDDTGLFVVQPGSILPDSGRVRSIEQRDGRPVLVTDSGDVLEISD